MGIEDHYRRSERMTVTIVTVDPATNRIEAVGKDAAIIQISVNGRPNAFRWPNQGEQWTVERIGIEWVLCSKLETHNVVPRLSEGQPGELMGPDGFIPQHKTRATNGQGLVWVTGQGWLPQNIATQVELDALNTRVNALEVVTPMFEMYLANSIAAYYPATSAFTKVPFDTMVKNTIGDDTTRALTNSNIVIAVPGDYLFVGGALENESLADGVIPALELWAWDLASGVPAIGIGKRMNFLPKGAAGNVTINGTAMICNVPVNTVIEMRASFPGAFTKTAGSGGNGRQFNFLSGNRIR